jgi:8-oxo-dGTP pyrophosphatase MutT (NUDIX family)
VSATAARIGSLRARLSARATHPAPADWLPVVVAGQEVGIAHPDVAALLATAEAGFVLLDYRLVLDDEGLDFDARSARLEAAARLLQRAGALRGWRDELMPVRADADAVPLATIERAACRPLGITTVAVHLNAITPDGELIVARRAPHKQIDPGKWDNLVGGMVPFGETELEALAREALEEAGLDIAPLELAHGGRVHVARTVPEGFESELVQVYDATIPDGTPLANRDGEVAAIERRSVDDVLSMIERDEFTLEAAVSTLDALARRTGDAHG